MLQRASHRYNPYSSCTASALPAAPNARSQVSGGHRAEVTPVPIPNTAVKLCIADDTARATAWESRTPPGYIFERPSSNLRAFRFWGAFFCRPLRGLEQGATGTPARSRGLRSHAAIRRLRTRVFRLTHTRKSPHSIPLPKAAWLICRPGLQPGFAWPDSSPRSGRQGEDSHTGVLLASP